jgi:hypothetical protein
LWWCSREFCVWQTVWRLPGDRVSPRELCQPD